MQKQQTASPLRILEGLIDKSRAQEKAFTHSTYQRTPSAQALVSARGVSVAAKKRNLLDDVEKRLVHAFSLGKGVLSQKQVQESFRKKIEEVRREALKLQDINLYLEAVVLPALRKKRTIVIPSLAIPKKSMPKEGIARLEVAALHFIEKSAHLDKAALKKYAKSEKKALLIEIKESKTYEALLEEEMALLCQLEAKLLLQKRIGKTHFSPSSFALWAASVFAILTYLRHASQKETVMLAQLKKAKDAKELLSQKIDFLLAEYAKLLKIEHAKHLSLGSKGGARLRPTLHKGFYTQRIS